MSRSNTADTYIVYYDITSNKLRRKLVKKLCDYGTRIQYSVFSVQIKPGKYAEMLGELTKIIERHPGLAEQSDSVISVRLSNDADMICLAGGKPKCTENYLVIG